MDDARVVGLLDGVRRVGPRVTALVALIGDQAVADDDEQTPLGRLREQSARQMAQRRAESGVPARCRPAVLGGTNRGSSKSFRHCTSTRWRVLPVNTKTAVPLAGERHRLRKRVRTRQFQLEDPAAVHTQRRTAVQQECRGDVTAAGQ